MHSRLKSSRMSSYQLWISAELRKLSSIPASTCRYRIGTLIHFDEESHTSIAACCLRPQESGVTCSTTLKKIFLIMGTITGLPTPWDAFTTGQRCRHQDVRGNKTDRQPRTLYMGDDDPRLRGRRLHGQSERDVLSLTGSHILI